MRMRFLLCVTYALLASICCSQEVLEDGKPALTPEMADKYVRFMGWVLDVPLTRAQEARIRNFLLDTWRNGDSVEIDRTVTLLATRDQIEMMGLQDDEAAKLSVRKLALRTWNRNPTMPAASWGMTFTAAATRPLVKAQPPLTKQMEDAYEELGYFLIEQAYGAKPTPIDAMQRVQVYEALARGYGTMQPAQRANFSKLPEVWVQIRRAWPTLSESDKSSLKGIIRNKFDPKPKATQTGKKGKGAPTVKQPAVGPEEATLARLLKMTWLTTTEVFSKLSAIGGREAAYGSGW